MPGHVPIGRIAALLAVIVAGVVLARGTGAPRFHGVAHGVEFATLRGDPYCRQGSSDIGVLRVDPARARVRVHHYAREAEHPLDILEWQRRTGATAVFNAGQYYPDGSYMGLLVCGGTVVSGRPHPTFKAALVAVDSGGHSDARVLDLAQTPLDPRRLAWSDVAQSFMLFDRAGGVRVRRSSQIAPRTIVGEDREHRLLVITTEGGYTLYDIAQLLMNSPLHVSHAMSMDGGGEAQLCVRHGDFHYASFGHWQPDAPNADLRAGLTPLPAVITVSAQ